MIIFEEIMVYFTKNYENFNLVNCFVKVASEFT